ncbi:MAG: DUF535 family protein, partial [Gammaproteobacteria bacterium]
MDTQRTILKVAPGHGAAAASLAPEPLLQQVRPATTTVWRGLRELHGLGHVLYPVRANHRFAKRARFMYRALTNPAVWQQWRGFLEASPFVKMAQEFPRLYEKPLRPYLHKDLDHAAILEVLRGHYLFLQRRAPAPFVECLLENGSFPLNERSLDGLKHPLHLNLTYARHMQQEGELTLSLGPADSVGTFDHHRWISALTFVLRPGSSGREILIGGIQGGHSENSREDIHLATQAFHGLRPKHLLIHLLREIAAQWGVSHIHAVSDSAHCLTRGRYKGRIKITSSYDELWRDVGGAFREDGFYSLP